MLNDCVVNALYSLAVLAILPFVFLGIFIFFLLFGAPTMYFLSRPNSRKLKLYEKYREEAVHLRGNVLKWWTSKVKNTTTRSHHIKVIYNIHQERYIKELHDVSPIAYLQTRLDLMVLPLYPRSAILLEEAQKTDVVGATSIPNLKLVWYFVVFSLDKWMEYSGCTHHCHANGERYMAWVGSFCVWSYCCLDHRILRGLRFR